MSAEPNNIGALLKELKSTGDWIDQRSDRTTERMDELERSINEVIVRQRRPGRDFDADGTTDHKSLVAMCEDRRSWSVLVGLETRSAGWSTRHPPTS